jgi:hypothetical protein
MFEEPESIEFRIKNSKQVSLCVIHILVYYFFFTNRYFWIFAFVKMQLCRAGAYLGQDGCFLGLG